MDQAVTEQSKPAPKATVKGIQITDKAIARVRSAMAKEGISPEQGGLRLGVQGGGCSGLSYNIRFDTQPRERDRVFQFDDVRQPGRKILLKASGKVQKILQTIPRIGNM